MFSAVRVNPVTQLDSFRLSPVSNTRGHFYKTNTYRSQVTQTMLVLKALKLIMMPFQSFFLSDTWTTLSSFKYLYETDIFAISSYLL